MTTTDDSTSNGHRIYTSTDPAPFRHIVNIGKGGFGVVDEVDGAKEFEGRKFARKTMTLTMKEHSWPTAIGKIQKEVDILRKLRSDHVVEVVQTYMFRNTYNIVLHPLADANLEAYLGTAHGEDEARQPIGGWFACLINGLAYIHEQDIQHRDIKPSNILVHGQNILFTDFGISEAGLGRTITTSQTKERARTPSYCAPEVERGKAAGRSSDIFSLGAVFLEMITTISDSVRSPDDFKTQLWSDRDKSDSYASNLSGTGKWIDMLEESAGTPYQSTILSLCHKMLHAERHYRPKAADVRLWWSYQPPAVLPASSCSCSAKSKHQSRQDLEHPRLNETLEMAYRRGYRLTADLAVEHGATLRPDTALSAAAEGGLSDIVQRLLDEGATANGSKALQAASAGGFRQTVEILLDAGADAGAKFPTRTTGEKCTALQLAVRNGHDSVARLLLRYVVGGHKFAVAAPRNAYATPRDAGASLRQEAQYGNEEIVGRLLAQGADTETTSFEGNTPLLLAARRGSEVIVWQLLERNARIEARNKSEMTPLLLAAHHGKAAAVCVLLNRRADIEARDVHGHTPLTRAARAGQKEVVDLLLKRGARVDTLGGHGSPALSWAARQGRTDMVKLLLDRGAAVDATDEAGRTPLSWAAESGRLATTTPLLGGKANLYATDKSGRTPLSWAAGEGKDCILTALFDAGAGPNHQDGTGRTPLSWAAGEGREATVKFLLKRTSQIDTSDQAGRSPLSWAAGADHKTIVGILLDKRANPNAPDASGRTALSWAAAGGRVAVVNRLLRRGSNVNISDTSDRTPLSWAAEGGHAETIDLLLRKRADPHARGRAGRPALSWAAGAGHDEAVRLLLLDHKVPVDETDAAGRTALWWAVANDRKSTAAFLISRGADPNLAMGTDSRRQQPQLLVTVAFSLMFLVVLGAPGVVVVALDLLLSTPDNATRERLGEVRSGWRDSAAECQPVLPPMTLLPEPGGGEAKGGAIWAMVDMLAVISRLKYRS